MENLSNNRIKKFSIILFIWMFTISFYFWLFLTVTGFTVKSEEETNLKRKHAFSVYKQGMEVINSLKGTDYLKYVQRIYVNPKEKNRLMIMIKPNYWNILTKDEKEKILLIITGKWRELYKKTAFDSKDLPAVGFANIQM